MGSTMTTTTVLYNQLQPALGVPVPPFIAHAISVSLPTWKDNIGYAKKEKRVMDAITSGYPRFVFHFSIQKVRSQIYPR